MSSTIAMMSVEVESLGAPYSRILVPTDGGALSEHATSEALKLAAATGAAVVFLTVNLPSRLLATSTEKIESTRREYDRRADAALEKASARANQAGVASSVVRAWNEQPCEEIIKVAREADCGLIAMGSRGRSGLSSVVLGSVTQKVLARSDIPVLVLRKSREADVKRPLAPAQAGFAGAGIA